MHILYNINFLNVFDVNYFHVGNLAYIRFYFASIDI